MRWLSQLRFTRGEVLFSVKCFAAAMLAMYCASWAGLPRPFWAMITAYVVANPLAGAVRSKAVFRFVGTLIGAVGALLIVPVFSSAPPLLTLAMALWVAVCLFIALLDRTPRSYVFMLAGYTAALIGFPSVETPQLLFDTAVSRVEEIWLGMFCASLVHSLVLPVGLAPSVLGLLDNTLRDARKWMADLMQSGEPDSALGTQAMVVDRRKLASDITQLRLLSTHVPFDATNLRWTVGALRAMQDQVAALTPPLAAIEDRLVALRQAQEALPADVLQVLRDIQLWSQAQDAPGVQSLDEMPRLRRAIGALEVSAAPAWLRALRVDLADRLDELIDRWQTCCRLRQAIDRGLKGDRAPMRRIESLADRVLHRDYGMALWSALAAALAVCLCSAFWILTGWSSGSAMPMMAAVFCSFFAAMDDPVPAITGFLRFALWSIPISTLYVLALLPLVQDIGSLAAVCAPVFLVLGCFMARPANFTPAMALLLFGVLGAMSLQDTGHADLVTYINSMLAQSLGLVAAALITGLVRSVGADWSARRIQRATWRELGEMAAASRPLGDELPAYTVRMLDRIGLLAQRVAEAGGSIQGIASDDALHDLRVGSDIATLQRVRARLAIPSAAELLREVAVFFRARESERSSEARMALQARIDAVLLNVLDAPQSTAEWRAAISALVGLRRNLCPGAPSVLAAPASGAAA